MRELTIETIEHKTTRDVSDAMEKVFWRMIEDSNMADNTPFVNRFVDLLQFVAEHQVVAEDTDLDEFMNMRGLSFDTLKASFKTHIQHIQFKQSIEQIAKIILQENDAFLAKTGKINMQGTKEISGDELYGLIDMIIDSGMLYHLDDTSKLSFKAKEASVQGVLQ